MGNRTIVEIDHDAFGAMNSSARASVGQWLADMIAFGTFSRTTADVRDNLRRHGITILTRRHSTDAVSVNVNGRLAWSENTEEKVGMTLHVEDMTAGQLKLHYAAKCQWHQADGVAALGYASRVPIDDLRAAMASYEVAAACEDWEAAEEALLSVVARSAAP